MRPLTGDLAGRLDQDAVNFLAEFGAPLDTPPSTPLKTLAESGSGMDVPALRTWLREEAAP